jgi:hypothetical protein
MKEHRQSKGSLKKQISLLLPLDIYDGAKRDAQRYNRSMAYHIVETLKITFHNSIQEVQAEREEASKMKVLQQMKQDARAGGKSDAFLEVLEAVFKRFTEVKKAEDFTEHFQQDIIMFATMMYEEKGDV